MSNVNDDTTTHDEEPFYLDPFAKAWRDAWLGTWDNIGRTKHWDGLPGEQLTPKQNAKRLSKFFAEADTQDDLINMAESFINTARALTKDFVKVVNKAAERRAKQLGDTWVKVE